MCTLHLDNDDNIMKTCLFSIFVMAFTVDALQCYADEQG